MTVDQTTKKLMIVLLPECLAGDLEFARVIHQMAKSGERDVLYLTLVDENDHLFTVSRRMTTMKAVTTGIDFTVSYKLTDTDNWLKYLKSIFRPGDQIVCQTEQTVKVGLLKTVPLSAFLEETFTASVRTVNGYYYPQKVLLLEWLHALGFWVGILIILGFFTLLEIHTDSILQGYVRVSIFLILASCEAGVLWAWNNLVKR